MSLPTTLYCPICQEDFDVEDDLLRCPDCNEPCGGDPCEQEPFDGFLTDAEADADVLASAGLGTDEDYGGFDSNFGLED